MIDETNAMKPQAPRGVGAHDAPLPLMDDAHHQRWMRQLALALVRDPALAEDLTQDVAEAALREQPGRALSRAWYATVMRRRISRAARTRLRQHEREQAAARAGFAHATESVQPSEAMERRELEQHAMKLVEGLPEVYRATLLATVRDDKRPTDLAKEWGVSAGTIRWRLKHGLDAIRTEMDERFGPRKTWAFALFPEAFRRLPAGEAAKGGAFVLTVRTWVALLLMLAAVFTFTLVARAPRQAQPAPHAAARSSAPGGLQALENANEVLPVGAVIEGHVVDEAGLAVPSAELVLTVAAFDSQGAAHEERTAMADEQGAFRLAGVGTGTYTLTARAGRKVGALEDLDVPALRAANGDTLPPTMVVVREADWRFSGVVADGDGIALPHAKVSATLTNTPAQLGLGGAHVAIDVDEKGRFELALPEGSYRVVARASGYQTFSEVLAIDRDLTRTIVLREAATLSGRVLEEGTQRPVEGAHVSLSPSNDVPFHQDVIEVISGEDGVYSTSSVIPGLYTLVARKGRLVGTADSPMVVVFGASSQKDIYVRPGATISGTVTDHEGGATEGAHLVLTPTGNLTVAPRETSPLKATTDAKGFYAFEGLAQGQYQVTLQEPVEGDGMMAIVTLDQEHATHAFTLPATFAVRGRVEGPEGQALAGARIKLFGWPEWAGISRSRTPRVMTADDTGRFRVPRFPHGVLVIHAEHGDLKGYQEVNVSQELKEEVVVRVEAGNFIEGIVQTHGRLSEGLHVSVAAPGGDARATTTNAQGRFRLGPLGQNVYAVRVSRTGGPRFQSRCRWASNDCVMVDLTGKRAATVSVSLEKGVVEGTLTGRVQDETGRAVPGAIVSAGVTGADGKGHGGDTVVNTDADGRFVFREVVKGRHRLWVKAPGFGDAGAGPFEVDTWDIVVTLKHGVNVRGHVTLPDGTALNAYSISFSSSAADPYGGTSPSCSQEITSGQGRFTCRDLPPGHYVAEVLSALGQHARQSVDLSNSVDDLHIITDPLLTIRGQVVPLASHAEVRVALSCSSARQVEVKLDAEGRFSKSIAKRGDSCEVHIQEFNQGLVESFRLSDINGDKDVGVVRLVPVPPHAFDRRILAAATEGGPLVVDWVAEGHPFERAGITEGASLIAVDGASTAGWRSSDLIRRLSEAKADIAVTFQRGAAAPKTVTIVRAPEAK